MVFVSWNISAISFALGSILSAFIGWRIFCVWKKQKENQVAEYFSKILLFLFLYTGIRAIVSFFFVDSPSVLGVVYILSHLFLAFGAAYMTKAAIVNFFDLRLAKFGFFAALILFGFDVLLNIFLPNNPHFNQELNIIEWGAHKYVGIFHTFLLWFVFSLTAILFGYKAFKNWQDHIIRTRSLLIMTGILLSIFVAIPRNIFKTPFFILISEIGFIATFVFCLWGISFGESKNKENISKGKDI